MKAIDLYLKLPHPLRQTAVLAASLKNRMTRYGGHYKERVELLERSQWWSLEEQREWQRAQLMKLLDEASTNTPYYREVLAHLEQADLREIANTLDMSRLPILPKQVLKARTKDFFNEGRRGEIESSTSGSTGSPLKVLYDRESMQFRFAAMHQLREWGGVSPTARGLRLTGREIVPADRTTPPFWVENPLEHQLIVSSYHMRPEHMNAILERVKAWAPVVVEGYPSAIAQLARASQESGIEIPSLRMAITTAETLDDQTRAMISQGLGVDTFDYYAASEGVPIIQQCEHGSYHLRTETGIFEILKQDGTPAKPGEIGELVTTSFAQWMTPLIRYKTGDLVEVASADEVCACGRTHPLIRSVLGRMEDLVITRDDRTIGMFSYRTLKHVPGIEEAQIVQRSPEHFETRLVLDGTRNASEVELGVKEIFERVLGYSITATFEHLEQIPRGANGKFRSTVRAFDSKETNDTTSGRDDEGDLLAQVALFIATFKADASVVALLESLAPDELARFARVIVVDSIGTGEMPALLKPWEETVDYHCFEHNLGSAGNLAQRLELATMTEASYAYAINHDGEVDLASIELLVSAAKTLGRPLGAAYPTRYHPSRDQYDTTGGRKRALPFRGEQSLQQTPDITDVEWSSSNGALYGLDPIRQGVRPWTDLWMGFEDLAFGRQLSQAGFPQIRVREAIFEHDYEYRAIQLPTRTIYISDKPDWYVYYFARNLVAIAQRLDEPLRDGITVAFRMALEAGLTAAFRENKTTRWQYLLEGIRDGLAGNMGKWKLP